MRRWVLLLALSPVLFLEGQPAAVTGRMQDLNFVATQLPKLDASFFAQLSPAAFQQAVNALQMHIATLHLRPATLRPGATWRR